jgi:hypothetical protein
MKSILRIWKYSLGSFSDSKTEPYDNWIAGIRTVIFVSYMVTNAFIVSGVVRHWNSSDCVSVDTELIKK